MCSSVAEAGLRVRGFSRIRFPITRRCQRYEAQRISGKVTALRAKPFELTVALTLDLQSDGLVIEVDGAPAEGVQLQNDGSQLLPSVVSGASVAGSTLTSMRWRSSSPSSVRTQ